LIPGIPNAEPEILPLRANWFRIVAYVKEACKANKPSEYSIMGKIYFWKTRYDLAARRMIVAISE
jgi:hypothetical protein